jgi:hypothetical protein
MKAPACRGAAALLAAMALSATLGAAGAAAAAFTTFNLAGTPPRPAGTVCPGASTCTNGAAEPAIRATPDGKFFASSESSLGAGTLAWRSTDGGSHYTSLLSANDVSVGGEDTGEEAGLEPGGGDTDVAIAPVKNASGFYNAYVASLTLANVDVSRRATTARRDRSTRQPRCRSTTAVDRRRAAKVCISYLTAPGILLPQLGLHIQCSSDGGSTFPQVANGYDTSDVGLGASMASRTGNLAFDPVHPGYLYSIFAYADVDDASDPFALLHNVGIAVSTDGGKTFHDYAVYTDSNTQHNYDNKFPNIAVDRAGNVYAVYSDGNRVT